MLSLWPTKTIGIFSGGEFVSKYVMTQLWKFILKHKILAVAILPSTAIYPQRLFCRELFVIGQS